MGLLVRIEPFRQGADIGRGARDTVDDTYRVN